MRLMLFLIVPFILFANELKNSTSPYLLQHKNNPVNWIEWSDRAFEKAKKENKFIFLSIGYSTCHWCHVMARESFSQKNVAKVLNKNFISIKVDRERRVDLDKYYQLGYQIVNGRGGGWPLTVVLMPNKKPIFFATYMPKDILIETLQNIVKTNKNELNRVANSIDSAIKKAQKSSLPISKIPNKLAQNAVKNFNSIYDYKHKGFSVAPKFPQASSIDVLLNIYQITKNKKALKMATDTLDAMAKGGIYDQIEGGFFRYSVDSKWQIPHFEKMLYTNAELISTYSKAYKITKKPLYAKVVNETIANIETRFNHNGLYYSASNADSPNEDKEEQEGYYYVFEYGNILNYLVKQGISKDRAKQGLHYFGIEQMGNFEGGDYSNPTLHGEINKFGDIKKLLAKYRAKKEYPFIDKKINTAWNALYIKALFDATTVNSKYGKIAQNRLTKLLDTMYKNKTLYHQTLLPNKPTQKGLLEDYSFVADAIFASYQHSLSNKYLQLYKNIVNQAVKKFYKHGTWYASSSKEFRVKASYEDSGYKSPLAQMVENILKEIALNADFKLLKVAKDSIKRGASLLKHTPQYYPTLLNSTLIYKNGLYTLKGQKDKIVHLKIDRILYPYIYKKVYNINELQICGLQSCYLSVKTKEELLKELKGLIRGGFKSN